MTTQENDLKLRAPAPANPPRVVLVEPEIPQNTGNIARLCAATRCPLHLVGPLGFSIDDKAVRRAGLDYWPLVDLHRQVSLAQLRHDHPDTRWILFSARSTRSYLHAGYGPGDALLFGRESVGLPRELLEEHADDVYAIPTLGPVRSLNLANAVSIVVYEALRQLGMLEPTFLG